MQRPVLLASIVAALTSACALEDPELGIERQEAMTVNAMTVNAMTVNAMTVNGLAANGAANYYMTRLPLNHSVWRDGTDAVSRFLQQQLTEPQTREFMKYLVSCALPEGKLLEARDANGASYTFAGALGLCPDWLEGPAGTDCQEIVSSCLLAHNNAWGHPVRFSLRHTKLDGSGVPLSPIVPALAAPTPSLNACFWPLTGDRSCGWTPAYVGTCAPGNTVTLEVASCSGDPMVRVCAGDRSCEQGTFAVGGSSHACIDKQISFTCPGEDWHAYNSYGGRFNVMTAPYNPWQASRVELVAVDGTSSYPASEEEVYSWREGSFYGNIFDYTKLNLWCTVELEYILTKAPPTAKPRLTCYGKDKKGSWTKLAKGEDFVGVVYGDAYSCHSPEFDSDRANAKMRVCAGPTGGERCAARWIGDCFGPKDGYGDALVSDGVPGKACMLEDNPAIFGDLDADDCLSPDERLWKHPVTTFLKHPCDADPSQCQL